MTATQELVVPKSIPITGPEKESVKHKMTQSSSPTVDFGIHAPCDEGPRKLLQNVRRNSVENIENTHSMRAIAADGTEGDKHGRRRKGL